MIPLVRLKLPLLSKLFVAIAVQFASGRATFVLVNKTYCPPANPFVPMKTRFVPDRLMLVMCGGSLVPPMPVTTRSIEPLAALFVR